MIGVSVMFHSKDISDIACPKFAIKMEFEKISDDFTEAYPSVLETLPISSIMGDTLRIIQKDTDDLINSMKKNVLSPQNAENFSATETQIADLTLKSTNQ